MQEETNGLTDIYRRSIRSGDTAGGSGDAGAATPAGALETLDPAYFGFVMLTGIVSIALRELGVGAIAWPLAVFNIGCYALSLVLFGARVVYPGRVAADLRDREHHLGDADVRRDVQGCRDRALAEHLTDIRARQPDGVTSTSCRTSERDAPNLGRDGTIRYRPERRGDPRCRAGVTSSNRKEKRTGPGRSTNGVS